VAASAGPEVSLRCAPGAHVEAQRLGLSPVGPMTPDTKMQTRSSSASAAGACATRGCAHWPSPAAGAGGAPAYPGGFPLPGDAVPQPGPCRADLDPSLPCGRRCARCSRGARADRAAAGAGNAEGSTRGCSPLYSPSGVSEGGAPQQYAGDAGAAWGVSHWRCRGWPQEGRQRLRRPGVTWGTFTATMSRTGTRRLLQLPPWLLLRARPAGSSVGRSRISGGGSSSSLAARPCSTCRWRWLADHYSTVMFDTRRSVLHLISRGLHQLPPFLSVGSRHVFAQAYKQVPRVKLPEIIALTPWYCTVLYCIAPSVPCTFALYKFCGGRCPALCMGGKSNNQAVHFCFVIYIHDLFQSH